MVPDPVGSAVFVLQKAFVRESWLRRTNESAQTTQEKDRLSFSASLYPFVRSSLTSKGSISDFTRLIHSASNARLKGTNPFSELSEPAYRLVAFGRNEMSKSFETRPEDPSRKSKIIDQSTSFVTSRFVKFRSNWN